MIKSSLKLLRTLALCVGFTAGVPALSHAATVDVVKIMSFSCSVCRAAELQDRVIERAVREHGGTFVWAPLPTDPNENGEKEMLYYASRDVSKEFSVTVKESLYKGIQELGLPLTTETQLFVWLQQDLTSFPEAELRDLFSRGKEPRARGAISRAAGLAQAVGADSLPTYIVLVDGRPVTSLSPSSVPGGSLSVLRDEVLNRISKLVK